MGSPGPDLPLVWCCHPILVSIAPSLELEEGVQFAFKERTKSEIHLALFDSKTDMFASVWKEVHFLIKPSLN